MNKVRRIGKVINLQRTVNSWKRFEVGKHDSYRMGACQMNEVRILCRISPS